MLIALILGSAIMRLSGIAGSKIQPSDLAEIVLFLASDAGRLISGELIAVSGNLE